MICAGDIPGVEPWVVGGPQHAGPLGAPVQLVVTLGEGAQQSTTLHFHSGQQGGQIFLLFIIFKNISVVVDMLRLPECWAPVFQGTPSGLPVQA